MVSPILMLVADRSVLFTTTVVVSGILIVVGVLFLLIGVFQLFGIIVPKINQKSIEMEEKRAARKAERKARRAAKKAAKLAEKNGEAGAVAVIGDAPEQTVENMVAPAPSPVVEQGISGEVVAAITAAIVASEGTGVVVRSIKKKKVSGRNPWAQAANIDNTRPF